MPVYLHVILSGLKMVLCVSASTVGKDTAPKAVVAKSWLEPRDVCNLVVNLTRTLCGAL